MEQFLGIVIFVGILWMVWRVAMNSLNAGLPKSGKGKKAKGGGDKVAGWTEGIVLGVFKGIGRAFWTIVTAPFRR